MVRDDTPITRELVLVGGGHAHVQVLRRFGMRPEPGVRVTLISRELHTPYSGMLPGLVAGHYAFDDAHIDLSPLARFAGARLLHDEVVGLDLDARRVLCRERPPVPWDVLAIDTGSAPSLAAAGVPEHAVPVKPVSSFHARWQEVRCRVLASDTPLTVAVVGGGAGGVELIMSARHRLLGELGAAGRDPARLRFVLVTAGDDVLPTHNARVRGRYRRVLANAGVEVHLASEVVAADENGLTTRDGGRIAAEEVLWVTTAAAPAWPRESGLATDEAGFISVDACLQSVSHPGVFAAGDVAAVAPHPRPKSGVFAVRQGPPLTRNLRRALSGKALVPFTPQRQFLSLIGTGDRTAVASRGPFAFQGRWVWAWKDWIDRRFIARFTDLPSMDDARGDAADGEAMRCGGCGAKIGASLLDGALAALRPHYGPDVLVGLDAPDDAAVVRTPPGTVSVQTVDAFRSFLDDPFRFGRIAATHALGDVFAMGATPQSALALVTLPLARPASMQADLVQLMSGALEVFAAEGTALVGGHTGEGAELTLGFAINGYAEEDALVRKTGAAPGDVLLLTKPLGTGVLFAAAMQGRARSRWLEAALAAMSQSNGPAARCLLAHDVHAMTDVTGFGLAGHLLEMLAGGDIAAELSLAALPLLDGAAALTGQGVASTLLPENLRAGDAAEALPAVRAEPAYALCFDPQTSGGLLAAVPAPRAEACLAALRAAGCDSAAIVGRVTGATPGRALGIVA